MADRNAEMTQSFSTFGDKLLQHCDRLSLIQNRQEFRPITIQLAPTEVCDSDCPFCSVSGRPLKSRIEFADVERILDEFRKLGAKSLEITGGGNPMLYHHRGNDINSIISVAAGMQYRIGMITNSHSLKTLTARSAEALQWVRISLIQLDEGIRPDQYDFGVVPVEKIGLSYIIYDPCEKSPRTKKDYGGTTPSTIEKIAQLVELYPSIKFVRIAGDCLQKGSHPAVKIRWQPVIDAVDRWGKFFVKDIGTNDGPFNDGCYVGLLRPYIAAHPGGGTMRPQVYICTSHVLNRRVYDLAYSLGSIDAIRDIWERCNARFTAGLPPYEVQCNNGKNWAETCKFCYYKPNNALLHSIINKLPDWEFA